MSRFSAAATDSDDITKSRWGWFVLGWYALCQPDKRLPVTISFADLSSTDEVADQLMEIGASAPVATLSRVQTAGRTITLGDGEVASAGEAPAATREQLIATLAPMVSDTRVSLAVSLADIDQSIADLEELAPRDPDAAKDRALLEDARADYVEAAEKVGSGAISAVTVTALPKDILRTMTNRRSRVLGVVPCDARTPSAVSGRSDFALRKHGPRSRTPRRVAAREPGRAKRSDTGSATPDWGPLRRADWADRWAPSRYSISTGLQGKPDDGLYNKHIAAWTVWGIPGSLQRYREKDDPKHNKRGFEYQVYPAGTGNARWSEDWRDYARGPIKKRKWASDLPGAYLDDLFSDTRNGAAPVFAVGSANMAKARYDVLYRMWYDTNRGFTNEGEVLVEPSITGLAPDQPYCAGHIFSQPSACYFGIFSSRVGTAPLRTAARWTCTARRDLNCSRKATGTRAALDEDPAYADANDDADDGGGTNPPTCASGEMWNGAECVLILSGRQPWATVARW